MTDNAFRARDIGLRAQKKIMSRMSNKTMAKTFIDGTTASLLDNIYRLAKIHVSFFFYFAISLLRSCHSVLYSKNNCCLYIEERIFPYVAMSIFVRDRVL